MSSDEPADIGQIKREVTGVFSRAAPIYDWVGPRFFSHFGHRLVELARIPSGAQVLDVATGRGAILFPAVEAVGPRGHVTGIDLSEAMVQETAEEIRRLKLENVQVRQMDAEYLQFPDASFDCVLIAITTWDILMREQWKWFYDLVNAHLPPEAETRQTPEPQSPPPPIWATPEGLEEIMKTAGFTAIQVVSETADFIYTSEQEWWSALWSHARRESLEKVEQATGSDGLDRFRAAAFERIQTIRQADGIHQLWPALFTLAIKPHA